MICCIFILLYASESVRAQQPDASKFKAEPAVARQVRLALVIGNSSYSGLPKLANPANDANAIADKLRSIAFRTTLVLDASEQDLRREVRKFASESADADIALVYQRAGANAVLSGLKAQRKAGSRLSQWWQMGAYGRICGGRK
jgi:hypothetical protein